MNQIQKTGSISGCFERLNKEKCYEEEFFYFAKMFPYFFKKAFQVCYENQAKLPNLFDEAFYLLNRILFQTEYLISLQKNGIYETLSFYLIKEKLLIQNFPEIYNPVSFVINEVLIRPCLSEAQEKSLEILKRFYYIFPQQREKLYKPIMILLTNLCLFGSEKGKKEAAVFLYHLVHRDKIQPIIDLLNRNDEDENKYFELLKPLLKSKYYTAKALAYPNDVDRIYSLKTLDMNIGFPLYKNIEAGTFFTVNFAIPSSEFDRRNTEFILCYKFKTESYDIKFGVYKLLS